jgi:pimeloyl-ACP methyl ester carboxylesterase
VVFLPGRWDSAAHFENERFIDAVRQTGLAVDMVAVEAHYGYYASRTVVTRLREDVIAPAMAQGYAQIWLVGVSMGGLGALLYVRDYPDDIAGVVALAPFLGEAAVVQEITRAGGLWQWHPASVAPGDYQRQLWQWLKAYLRRHAEAPRLYLGYGQRDHFAPANRLLAMYLPEPQVLTTTGGHEWAAWRALWQTFLNTSVAPHVAP